MLDYQQLKTELLTDPAGLGYEPLIRDHMLATVAGLMNAVEPGETLSRAEKLFGADTQIHHSHIAHALGLDHVEL